MNDCYDDIIDLPAWEPRRHRRMDVDARAAQFAPFAALTGHEAAIRETARTTDAAPHPEGTDAERLNRRVALLLAHIDTMPKVTVTHFVPDQRKSGGSYVTTTGQVKRYDDICRNLVFTDGRTIEVRNILDITGTLFDEEEWNQ